MRADDHPRLREEVPLLEESRRLVVILIVCRNEITILEIPTIVLLHVLHQLPNHQRENTG